MKLQVQLPREEEIVNAVKTAGAIVVGIIIVKTISAIIEKAHEKKQDKEIKKLKNQVADQEARLAKLEKA